MNDIPKNYYDIYMKRLNRYGTNYQSRTQNKREIEFEDYLLKSVYRIDFEYGRDMVPATFERLKQDPSEALHYLLTRISDDIPSGTILMIPNKNEELKPWMVYYLEEIQASGYNRYVMLRMSHFITWKDAAGSERTSWGYLHGKGDNILRDSVKSKPSNALYTEDMNINFIILPTTKYLKKDDYLEIGEGELKEAYRVTGYDIQSTPGIQYVSIDPIYIHDKSETPEKEDEDNDEDFFWFEGGN